MELHIRGVSKTYPNGVQPLLDVTLTIPAGMYGLLGPRRRGSLSKSAEWPTKREDVRAALTRQISKLPSELRRTLTWDQGKQMADHVRFSTDTNM